MLTTTPNKSRNHSNKTSIPRGLAIVRSFNSKNVVNHISKVRLVTNGIVASNGVGVITQTFNFSAISSASEWTQYSALYDEFRMLAIKLTLIPYQQGSVTALNGLVALVYDDDDTVVLTSMNSALEYDTMKLIPAVWTSKGQVDQHTWVRPSSGENTAVTWVDVATPANSFGSLKFYSTGLTATTTYFTYAIEYYCQFRGKR